jgi:SNF family Na+-dependent transporter
LALPGATATGRYPLRTKGKNGAAVLIQDAPSKEKKVLASGCFLAVTTNQRPTYFAIVGEWIKAYIMSNNNNQPQQQPTSAKAHTMTGTIKNGRLIFVHHFLLVIVVRKQASDTAKQQQP